MDRKGWSLEAKMILKCLTWVTVQKTVVMFVNGEEEQRRRSRFLEENHELPLKPWVGGA